jgi:hypothetical protein
MIQKDKLPADRPHHRKLARSSLFKSWKTQFHSLLPPFFPVPFIGLRLEE